MFNNLTERLSKNLKKLSGKNHLNENNIKNILKDIRKTLLESDVSWDVIKIFLSLVKKEAIGKKIPKDTTLHHFFTKIVYNELVKIMGGKHQSINIQNKDLKIILLSGLQGAGKTTTTAKLAKYMQEKYKKNIAVVSCDIYRPSAISQLKILTEKTNIMFLNTEKNDNPEEIVKNAILIAKERKVDILFVDTAGRMHIDQDMMHEIKRIHEICNPIETLFIADSMTGQDAIRSAKLFNENLSITGVILTKTDGDNRGGAALSIRYVTGKPIKFLCNGESIDSISQFHPDRIASLILNMGDMLSLFENIESKLDKKKSIKLSQKIKKGDNFDLFDLRDQLDQINKMGGLSNIIEKIPGMSSFNQNLAGKVHNQELKKIKSIINSMTNKERTNPIVFKQSGAGSRKLRISKGSGTTIQDVNKVLKKYLQMKKMMQKFKGKNIDYMKNKLNDSLNLNIR